MNFTIIDWFFSVLIIIFALSGLIKGFIDNVFGKLALILGIILACFFYDDVSETALKGIENPALERILGFLLVFVVVFLVIKLIQMIISKIFEWNILKSLDRTLGLLFGIVEGLAVVGLLIFILLNQPFFPVEKLLQGSFYCDLINKIFIKTKEISVNV